MKKLSKKVLAIILAIMMVATSAPFAAMAATDAASSKLTELSDEIDEYRTKMNGQKIYTNMAAAYSAYINAVKVYDKAKYGAENVTESEITTAKNSLDTATNAMAEWVHPTGTSRPNSSTKGFSADSNTNTTVNSNTSGYAAGWRPFADATGNTYVSDIYSSTYKNLIYFQSSVSSAKGSWSQSNCHFELYVPETIILYDGSDGFEARVGVMANYWADKNKKRKIAQIYINGNDNFSFGDNWIQNAKSDGDTNFGVTSRFEELDFVAAIGRPSPTDRASGNATADSTGTRKSEGGWTSAGKKYKVANYMKFVVPDKSNYTNASYSYTSIPVQSKSGDTTYNDTWNGNVTIKVDVLNYMLLLNKLDAAKQLLRITAEDPYLEGGLSNLISSINSACSWTPSGSSISTLASNMNTYITNLNTAMNGVSHDDSPYGALAEKMGNVLSVSGTLGDWYNVNHDTGEYTDASIQAFVKAFTYAQSVFDQNSTFADSYSFSAKSVTVGSGETAVTVSVPAATKTVTEVYNDLMAAVLVVSERVDVTTLVLYIEELAVALANADVYGIAGSTTEENMENAVENAKYRIWGETTLTDPETGETYTVSNYGNPAKLPKATTANQNKVTTQENNLRPYIEGLVINQNKTVVFNDVTGQQNSLGRIKQDMADTNLYPRGDYINGDTLDEAINYVTNNFIPQVIPNANTSIVAGIVAAKVAEYKSYIQYCQDTIDALQKTFLALDNGTIIDQGTQEVMTPSAIEDKWALDFARYNNVVVFRTTKAKSTLNLGPASISFTQGDTVAWAADNEYRAVLDSISINDTAGGSNEIRKENAISTSELPSVELTAEQCAQYPGCLSMSTSNGGTYGVANFVGVRGKSDGAGGYLIGKNGDDGSLTSGLAVTDGTQGAASGVWAYDNTTTLVSGNAYLDLAAESSATLTRTTTPKQTSYTNTGYFGTVFYWIADGAGLSAIKNVYNGYYHERTSSTYTQTTTVVDISNLKELVATMNTLNKLDYTEASWNNMKTKLAAATSNDFGSGKTYREVTTASLTSQLVTRYQNLYDAWKGLIPAATNIELTRPVAQAQNEGKDIGAVVRANDNVWYIKYNTNNDVSAQNTYGTYTTNTWNDFKTAYEAGDVAIFGDGTNPGIYATPVLDNDGNTVVVGTRGFARFINNDGDPVDLGDLESYGLTINDIDAVEHVSGISLGTEQAAINTLAANIKSKYNALKRWATFTPVDTAIDELNGAFTGNYNRKYTVASLQNINTTFAGLATGYYTIANDAAAQHELNRSGQAIYTEDDDAAIAAEAQTIRSCLPPTASSLDLDVYTPAAIIAQAEAAASDPDAYDAQDALDAATTLSNNIFATVNITPLNNLAVEGVNFASNAEIDDELEEIMELVTQRTYNVTVKDIDGNVIATYANQPYGTVLSIESQSGEPVEWTYSFTSQTVTTQKPTRVGRTAVFEFVVVGTTEIVEDEPTTSGATSAGYKILFDDNLDHAYAVEYAPAGSTLTIGDSLVVINYPNGDQKEVPAPDYAFYNLQGFNKSGTIDVTGNITIIANYEPDYSADGYTLDVAIINNGTVKHNEFEVGYSDKIELNEEDLRAVQIGPRKFAPGTILINDESQSLQTRDTSLAVGTGTAYAFTVVFENDFDAWEDGREEYDPSALGTETPMAIDQYFKFFPTGDAVIVVYGTQDDYETAIDEGFINDDAHTSVKPELVLANTKFTMHGRVYTPGLKDDPSDVIECGMLVYLGENEIVADDLTLATYTNMDNAYRMKYTKSLQFNNINVSVTRTGARFHNKTVRVRYRSYVKYRTTDENNNPVIDTIYSDLADDTQAM